MKLSGDVCRHLTRARLGNADRTLSGLVGAANRQAGCREGRSCSYRSWAALMWNTWAPQHAACMCERHSQALCSLTGHARRQVCSLPQPAAAHGAAHRSPMRIVRMPLRAAPARPASHRRARRLSQRRCHLARLSAGHAAAPALERGAPDLGDRANGLDRSTDPRARVSGYDPDSSAALAEQKAAHREALAERDPRSVPASCG